MIARRAIATGRVQGVFFRAHAQEAARRAGAAGWAANRPDGSVEVHVEGSEDAVAAVLDAVRAGPPGAQVGGVAVRDAAVEGCAGFDRR